MHHMAFAKPDRFSSRNTSLMIAINSQNHATSSMNQKMETITSQTFIRMPSLLVAAQDRLSSRIAQ